jgi:caffeoyl-CoA O-methyltransferase
MASCNPAQAAFDIVFVDADKTRLIDYVNALVGNDRVLKRGGLILVDNVLWKGLVLDAASGGGYDSGGDDEPSEDGEMLQRNRRARKLANKMHRFNSAVVRDERVEVLMMNIRDGLSLIRKR